MGKTYTPEEVLNLQSQAYQKGLNEGYELHKKETQSLEKEIRQLERANVELYFDGLRFHKWLIENNWMQHSNGRWYRSKDRHQWPPEEVCTEEELIHKYKRYISTC